MSDRIINSAWRFVVMSLIFVLGSAAMMLLYQGILELLAMRWQTGFMPTMGGCVMSAGIYWLARHRNDLVGA